LRIESQILCVFLKSICQGKKLDTRFNVGKQANTKFNNVLKGIYLLLRKCTHGHFPQKSPIISGSFEKLEGIQRLLVSV